MAYELLYILEIKRLVCLVGVVFAFVIMFQYFEYRNGDIRSSLVSATKVRLPINRSYPHQDSSDIPKNLGNSSHFDGANEGHSDVLSMGSKTPKKGHGAGFKKGVQSGRQGDFNDIAASDKDAVLGNQVEAKHYSVVDKVDENGSLASVNNTLSAPPKGKRKKPKGKVVSISEMYDILVRNRASYHSMKPRWPSTADQELLEAKLKIENAPINGNDHTLYPSLFRNVSKFARSYELMETTLKVYIYKEGEKPIFHQPQAVLKGIYASEGWFMKHMKASKHFVTKNPKQAHLFYLPYSSKLLKATLSPNFYDPEKVVPYLKNYLDIIVGRYNFWNRSNGSDHFLVACHDWAAAETRQHMGTCIRALCNTDVEKEGYVLGKDVSLHETNIRYIQNPLRELGGKPPSKRPILAFFAGQMHGNFRPILLRHWENKDPEMKIFGRLPKVKDDKNYIQYMKNSKYCICAKGSEVNSPRVVEAIFYECVPVIISDNFVPPFFEVLNWESFAVFVLEKDIMNLKNVLLSISNRRYLVMQQRVKQVQKHFLWHLKPVKYDIFHMILHSIWYNRVFRANPN